MTDVRGAANAVQAEQWDPVGATRVVMRLQG